MADFWKGRERKTQNSSRPLWMQTIPSLHPYKESLPAFPHTHNFLWETVLYCFGINSPVCRHQPLVSFSAFCLPPLLQKSNKSSVREETTKHGIMKGRDNVGDERVPGCLCDSESGCMAKEAARLRWSSRTPGSQKLHHWGGGEAQRNSKV